MHILTEFTIKFIKFRSPYAEENMTDTIKSNIFNHYNNNSFSDHCIMIKIYNNWLKSILKGNETDFCNSFSLSLAKLEMIAHYRSELICRIRKFCKFFLFIYCYNILIVIYNNKLLFFLVVVYMMRTLNVVYFNKHSCYFSSVKACMIYSFNSYLYSKFKRYVC